jgi:predicted membrane protein
MGFLLTKYFWGTILIGWGVCIILEKIFSLKIPYGKFLLAFLLIYAGIYLIMRTSSKVQTKVSQDETVIIDVKSSSDGRVHNTVFGSMVIDLTSHTDPTQTIKVNTVFGTAEVFLSSDLAYCISVNSVFGETTLPNTKEFMIESKRYFGNQDSEIRIPVEINTVFGQTTLHIK